LLSSFKINPKNKADRNGHLLFAFSALRLGQATAGQIVAMPPNALGFSLLTNNKRHSQTTSPTSDNILLGLDLKGQKAMAPQIHTASIELDYPLYGVDFVGPFQDALIVGGGGGESKSGVANKIV
jgi:hypothetical protein